MRYILAVLALLSSVGDAAAAEPRWTMIQLGTTTIIGDQPAGTLRDVAIQIEQFRAVVGGLIAGANRPASLPTVVFVFGERKAIQPLAPLYNGKPVALAGYFGQGPYANYIILTLEGFEESTTITYHEYTHLLIRNAVRWMPMWLNEGLAEYYSSYALTRGGRSAEIGRPSQDHLVLLRERYIPVAELIAVDHKSPMYNEGQRRSIFYAESWALTHYLLARPDGASVINKYVAETSGGRTPEEAFRIAFGSTPEVFDTQLREYVRRFRFTGTRFNFTDKLTVGEPSPGRTMTAGEVEAWLADAQRRVGRMDEAAPRIERAAAAEPGTAIAQLALGLLRGAQNRLPEGFEALGRAAALAPDDFLTQFVRGVSLLREGVNEAEMYRTEAVAALKRAVMLNGASADAHAALAYAQMLSDDTLADARTSIERAVTLAPGRLDYRLRYADVRILQGEVAAARVMLRELAELGDPDASSRAKSRLAAIADAVSGPLDSRGKPSRSVETPGIDLPDVARSREARPQLRTVRSEEERALGMLTRIDCAASDVRFVVQAADRTLVATTSRMEDVELISFRDDIEFTISCGARDPGDRVYLTWRPDANPTPARVGTAVAVEFLPKNFVP